MKFLKIILSCILLAFFSKVMASETSFKGEIPLSHFNWTGLYGGFNVGVVNHTMDITDVNASSFLATIQQNSDAKFSGGLQLGYRYQIEMNPVSGVYGIEISANFSNAQFEKDYGSSFALYELNSENALKDVCLIELIGGIAVNRTLLFLAAGASWVNITGTTSNLDSIAFFDAFNVDKKEWGTALGAGIEYAFSDKFSARLKVDVITPHTYDTDDNVDDVFQISNQIVQGVVGINYKFL